MTKKEKQKAINNAAWKQFEKTGDFSTLLDIRFIISDNLEKEIKGEDLCHTKNTKTTQTI